MEQIQLPKVKKRRLKRFLPLLLLIIAVAAGYYGVQIIVTRENTIVKPDVKQLCKQLLHDLQTDTANLQKAIAFDTKLVNKNDSLLMILQGPIAKSDSGKIRQLIVGSYFSKVFRPSYKTIAAIKNQFHLKELSSSKIPVYIADYENSLDTLKALEDLQSHDLDADIQSFFKAHFRTTKKQAKGAEPAPAMDITNIPEDDIEQFNTEIDVIQSFNNDLIVNSKKARDKAVKLMGYVKKLYRL